MPDLNHNIARTHGFEPLRIDGTLPEGLSGTLYRVGPGLVERFGNSVHPFLADGLITAVRLGGGAMPEGACELVRSDRFCQEERAGRALYGPDAPLWRRLANGLSGTVKNTGNTNVLAWRDQLFALMEQGQPVAFDAANLASLGSRDLGVIKGSFSAHPHRVETLKTTFNFGVRGRDIHLYALPDDGPAREITRFRAPWASLIHDFIVTDRHAVFFIDPSRLVLWRAVLGLRDFSKYFYWDERESSRIIVVPLAEPGKIRQIETDPFRVWHFANAFEDGGDIVVDAFRHDNIAVLTAPTTLPDTIPAPRLMRYRLSPDKRRITQEALSAQTAEFPSVAPRVLGQRHRHVLMQTYADAQGNEGLARLDTETGSLTRYCAPAGHLVSEPMFVPGPNAPEQGWVLQLTQDSGAGESYLAVFDSGALGDGPVARLWFDQPIPATFHGTFVPGP